MSCSDTMTQLLASRPSSTRYSYHGNQRCGLSQVAQAQAHSAASVSAERPSNHPLRLSPNSGTPSAIPIPARPNVGVRHSDLGPNPGRIAHGYVKACNMLLLRELRSIWRCGRTPTDVGAGHPLLGMSHPLLGASHPLQGMSHPLQGINHPLLGMSHPLQGMSHPLHGMGRPFQGRSHRLLGRSHPLPGATGTSALAPVP